MLVFSDYQEDSRQDNQKGRADERTHGGIMVEDSRDIYHNA